MACIVGADHQNDGFRREAVYFAVSESPEDILGFIGVVAEVENGFSRESFGDDLRGAGAFQSLGDRVSDKDEINRVSPFVNLTEFLPVARHPPFPPLWNRNQGGRQGVIRGLSLPKGSNQKRGQDEGEGVSIFHHQKTK